MLSVQSQIMLQRIIDLLPIRIFWKDYNGKFLGCNKIFANDAGFEKPEELIGKNDNQMVWKDQAKQYIKDDEQVMESGLGKLHIEEYQTIASGETRWVNTSKVPLIDMNGSCIGVLGTYEDITDRKSAEDELIKSHEKYRLWFEQDLTGNFVSTKEGLLIDCNPAFVNMFGI